jgi:membrane protein DedA with SNARE-associated domain
MLAKGESVPPVDLLKNLLWGFLALLATAVVPIPEEINGATVGAYTGSSMDEFGAWRWLMLPASILGAIAADVILYSAGRLFGDFLERKGWLDRLAPPAKRDKIHKNFGRYGVWIFVVARMIPGIRSTLFLTAGTMKLPPVSFFIADAMGAVIGTSLFFLLGYAFGAAIVDQIWAVEAQINPYKTVLVIILISLVGAYLIYRYLRQPITTGDPEDVPLIGHQIATHLPDKTQHEVVLPPPVPCGNGEPAATAQPAPSPKKSH